ncbi:hypothetical protein [Nocardia paucivorans]|uniref:hypothetical protein n=1 Tax=Nocardia paucivorans TaxID=114259 RepID=UPI0002EEA66B|nr:hypothetical protein [Nocardia paucivorans]
MSWEDQHRRTDILHTILDRAAVDPRRPDLFDGIPDLERLFDDADGVVAALRYRWKIHLDAKLEMAAENGRTAADAYLELAAEQPVLRAVLDARTAPRVLVA